MADREDFSRKIEKLRLFLRERGCSAAILGRRDNFAWISGGGDSTVVRDSEQGVALLVATPAKVFLVAYTMDADRVYDDELAGTGVEVLSVRWHEGSLEAKALSLCGPGDVLSDFPIDGADFDRKAIRALHYPLSGIELGRCRELGARTEAILRRAADSLTPDMTEAEAACELDAAYARAGIAVEVLLVGGSARIARYRHPLPSDARLGDTVLLHSAARWKGLHANVTRMLCFGAPKPEFEKAYEAVACLQALSVSMCRPGTRLRSIFEERRRLYDRLGFADEWELHFPGGTTGYALCEGAAGADPEARVGEGMAFDWFVTVTGAKVEELSLSGEGGGEMVSVAGGWPTRPVAGIGASVATPWILER